jgi:hypothetical protein
MGTAAETSLKKSSILRQDHARLRPVLGPGLKRALAGVGAPVPIIVYKNIEDAWCNVIVVQGEDCP